MSLRGFAVTGLACALGALAVGCASSGSSSVVTRPQPAPEFIVEPPAVAPDQVSAGQPLPPAPLPRLEPPPEALQTVEDEPTLLEEILAVTPPVPEPSPTLEATAAVTPIETIYDIDIPMNERVLRFIDLFTGRLKGYLEEGLGRGAQYLPMIQEVFRAEGLPLDLAYVPLVESAFKPSALSRAKARGIWQFMRGTALENGLQHDWYIDERAEPEKATRAAAKYLKTLYDMYGDWHLALAAYNGGPGRVQRAMKRSGRDDFWTLSASSRYLPRETREYVPLILAAIVVARNPVQYGMTITPFEVPDVETIRVAGAVDIRRLAEWGEVSVETIQALNPELRRWTTPVRAEEYEVKVPSGTGDQILERMTFADPSEVASLNWYRVKKGQTLAGIARALKVTRTDLAEANYLPTNARLSAGQRLIVPRAPSMDADTIERAVATSEADTSVTTAAVERSATRPAVASRRTHVVKRGDTLFSIARLYDTTVDDVRRWNQIRGSSIRAGQRLKILANDAASGTR